MANMKKKVCAPVEKIADVEDDIRALINLVKIKNNEDLDSAEGEVQKIEDATADEIIGKLRKLAEKLGYAFD
jgi:hypothetical protein